MSAPPMAAVVVKPFKKLSTVFAARHPAAIAGAPGAMVMNAPIDAMLAPRSELFIRCRPGRASGREDMRPASFKNATIDPVNVTPPAGTHQHDQRQFSRIPTD